jgi:hypothetical protein
MDWSHVITIGLALAGATWALRSALAKIEAAISGHVAEDRANHENTTASLLKHETRIVKLEGRRKR